MRFVHQRPREVIEFIIPATDDDRNVCYAYLFTVLRNEELTREQLLAYYYSVFTTFVPDLKLRLQESLGARGLVIKEIRLPIEADNNIDLPNIRFSWPHTLAYLAQMILILFKNIQSVSYQNLMSSRTSALCSFIGVDPSEIDRAGYGSESEGDEEAATVSLTNDIGRVNQATNKSAVKLQEIGPRMTLQLVKIEEGLCSGGIIFSKYGNGDGAGKKATEENQESDEAD